MHHPTVAKSVLFSALCASVLLLGCGAAPEPSVPELEQQQAAASSTCPTSTVVCGSTCPAGTHIGGWVCSCATGGISCSQGQTADGARCVQNTEAFFLCGSSCPSGYVAYSNKLSYDCNTTVGSLQGSPQTLCANH